VHRKPRAGVRPDADDGGSGCLESGNQQDFHNAKYLNGKSDHFDASCRWSIQEVDGGWKFTPLSADACRIEFNLDFEFTNKLIELAFGRIFKELAANMVDAFTVRAKEVYSAG
jgi:ribosome-associated toxin RatA of RatAB toxin-antitoxin module